MSELHGGHRERLRERFLQTGFNGFAQHEVLELLLFYAIPRKNTNALAHLLIDRFGSFNRVLEAPYEELVKVEGVGPNTAVLIKSVFEGFKFYNSQQRVKSFVASSAAAVAEYARNLFFGETGEASYLLCFDVQLRLCGCHLISRGNVNATVISVRNVVELATRSRAVSVILAHNHPGGVAMPSASDILTTKRIVKALSEIGISVTDHVIVADDSTHSMSESGAISMIRCELGIR